MVEQNKEIETTALKGGFLIMWARKTMGSGSVDQQNYWVGVSTMLSTVVGFP